MGRKTTKATTRKRKSAGEAEAAIPQDFRPHLPPTATGSPRRRWRWVEAPPGLHMIGYISWPVNMHYTFLGIPIFPHGLLIILGGLAGAFLSRRYTRREGLPDDTYWSIFGWIAIGGFIGMRLIWALGNLSQLSSPLEVLMIWHGGMTLFGGIAGAVVAGVWRARKLGVPVLAMADCVVPGFALALVIGRLSDLIIGDHLGKATTMPWGFKYVGVHPPGSAPPIGSIVHPVALYDAINVSILLVVLIVFLRRQRAPGSAAALFALWYPASRIFTDFLRTDTIRAFGMTGTQLTSILVVAGTVVWLVLRQRRGWTYPRLGDATLSRTTEADGRLRDGSELALP